MKNKALYWISISLISGFALSAPALAADKGKSESNSKTSMSQSKGTTGGVSGWIAPALPETPTYAIKAEAGSTIPLKFRLFTNESPTVEVTSGTVVVTTEVVAPCPVNVPSPAPTANKLGQTYPGKSASSAVRYLGKSWNVNWKLDKQAQGCFKFKATFTAKSLVLTSPTIVVYPKR